ncbi:MAG TPA: hypothetical protein VMV97_05625 [Sulfuriferula sp.]|nr:hypothetical protein [Sulfuriferula sp.]
MLSSDDQAYEKVDQIFMLAMTGYNLVRMRTLGQLRLQIGEPA